MSMLKGDRVADVDVDAERLKVDDDGVAERG